jgi:hypothetical protein
MRTRLSRDQLTLTYCERDAFLQDTLNAMIEANRRNGFNPATRSNQDDWTHAVMPPIRSRSPADWVQCQSLDAIPAFGICQVYGGHFDSTVGDVILSVQKVQDNAKMFAAAEFYGVQASGYGWVRLLNPYVPRRVNYYGSSPAWFDELTVTNTSVTSGNGGQLLCVGTADAEGHVAVMTTVGTLILKGQTTTTHAKGQTKTVAIYRRGLNVKGMETFTAGDTVQAYNTFATVAAGKWVAVAYIDGGWELIDAEC